MYSSIVLIIFYGIYRQTFKRWWSFPMLAPLLILTVQRELRHDFPLISRWSSWLLSLPFGEHHVWFYGSLGAGKGCHLYIYITRSFVVQFMNNNVASQTERHWGCNIYTIPSCENFNCVHFTLPCTSMMPLPFPPCQRFERCWRPHQGAG